MAITYPLSLPSAFRVQFLTMGAEANVAVGESPYSFAQEVQVYQGQRWLIRVSLPPVERVDGDAIQAFLLKLNGREGTFLTGDPARRTPRGAWAGSPVVDNGSPNLTLIRSNSLPVRGLTASTTVKAGDYLQLGSGSLSRLYRVLDDATASGTGRATLTVWPNLQIEPNDGDALTVSQPKGVFRLIDNVLDWSVDATRLDRIDVAAHSVI